jgi:cell division transport system ATP-binding protein
MVRLDSVSLRYRTAGGGGPEVLHALSLHIAEGGFCWLLGPSGAGKSSLLHLLGLLLRPSDGRLFLFGTDTAAARRAARAALRRRIGLVFQDQRLLPHWSTFDNAALPLRLAGQPERQVRADVTAMLRWCGLDAVSRLPPPLLSAGERQQLAIARAIVIRPRLLLADEPTAGLDARATARLLTLFDTLNQLGTTIVVATCDATLARDHFGTALWLRHGRLAADA